MIVLRRCNIEDCELIYEWANDPIARKNAFNTNIIDYDEHSRWFKDSLNNANRIMFVAYKDGIAVGQIRLDKEKSKAVISYSIDKNNRGKGYASILLNLIKGEALKYNISFLEGLVKKGNIPSRKAFIRNKFIEYEEKEYFRYEYFL